uniref:Uncharacterized protein n=1 Tax=Rhizophora mucronata TaxID=61149 RepID=A0A2P2IZI2_RHIMU
MGNDTIKKVSDCQAIWWVRSATSECSGVIIAKSQLFLPVPPLETTISRLSWSSLSIETVVRIRC